MLPAAMRLARAVLATLTLLVITPMTRAADWTTPAETARFKTTPDYATTRAYLERLAAAAPDTLHLTRFGVSPEGRELMLVVATAGGEFTPDAARRSGKQILMVQAGIHAGEIEGKDAGLMLLRDLTVGRKYPHLLDHTILLYLPIFNVDGHENSTPYNRINQLGPEKMGFRATAQNLNLNRDYLKADAPEMHAWLALFNAWLPDLFVDVHTTDGADYRYDLTWYTEDWGPLDQHVKAWQEHALKEIIFPQVEKQGHLLAPYLDLKDHRDITRGIANFGSGPRFSTGYVALQNRAALLVETHMLKPYETRVRATYDLVVQILDHLGRDTRLLREAVTLADRDTAERGERGGATLPILFAAKDNPLPFQLAGVAFTQTHSDISGDVWTQYDPATPKDYEIPNWRDLVATQSVELPAAYAVPAGWPQIIAKLTEHGIAFDTTTRPQRLAASRYRIDEPRWAKAPFEGRLMLEEFRTSAETGSVDLPPGSAIVPLDQRAANVVVNLLEPRAPDSLLRWGFFNAIFEQKESGDARVLEQLARDMLAKDAALKAEFEAKLKADAGFAQDPRARLEFFYRRSPWYATQRVGGYPVVRLDAAALATVRAGQ